MRPSRAFRDKSVRCLFQQLVAGNRYSLVSEHVILVSASMDTLLYSFLSFFCLFLQFSSVQFSCSVMSDSLQPHGLQHARPPSPSPTPGVYSDSWQSSQWCHPIISSSVVPFSSCLQSFPGSGSFPVSQFFASGGQSIGVSASASVVPMNTQVWFPLGWTGWISWQSKGLSRVFSSTTVQKHQFFSINFQHPYMTTGKTIALTRWTFDGEVMSLLFNILSRLVITFLPRSKSLLISWLQSPSVVILEPPKIKSVTVSTVYPSICHEVMGPDAMTFIFWMLSFKPTFSLSSFLGHFLWHLGSTQII